MVDKNTESLGKDGDDEIIFSQSYNLYENKLTIENIFDVKLFIFFETKDPEEGQVDIDVVADNVEKVSKITLSNKFRNTLGSMTTEKLHIMDMDDPKVSILFSIYGQRVGDVGLVVTVNLYKRPK
jgi:hypothetical protein